MTNSGLPVLIGVLDKAKQNAAGVFSCVLAGCRCFTMSCISISSHPGYPGRVSLHQPILPVP